MRVVQMYQGALASVAKIEEECFTHPWSKLSLEEYLNNPDAYFYVAKDDDGNVLGYIGTYIVCDEAYVTNVAVLSSFRGRGIGTALLKVATENAKMCGASFITLEVRLSNHEAQSLYRKLDYESSGVRPGFYRDPKEDALIMTKRFKD